MKMSAGYWLSDSFFLHTEAIFGEYVFDKS